MQSLTCAHSFFMFYLYAAPAVRMGALQHLQVIHVATHDSISMSKDGPTHQPIELAALYRAMPKILYIRLETRKKLQALGSPPSKRRTRQLLSPQVDKLLDNSRV